MCEYCGCEADAGVTATNLQTGRLVALHQHLHNGAATQGHEVAHAHAAPGPHSLVELGTRVLAKNDALATANRTWLAERQILALNLMGGPGTGKTTLLERTIRDLRDDVALYVLEGDQATTNDGERVQRAGAKVVQVNTGTGCHLDAHMVAHGLDELAPASHSIVFIENVGNLVCPALFDLGERRKVAMLSSTEGEDKPLKYPHMFQAADLVVINKIDLVAHVDFNLAQASANVRDVNATAPVFSLSARTGEGFAAWYRWLRDEAAAAL
jgi:hydrogenase nickel incorporation protein HypB